MKEHCQCQETKDSTKSLLTKTSVAWSPQVPVSGMNCGGALAVMSIRKATEGAMKMLTPEATGSVYWGQGRLCPSSATRGKHPRPFTHQTNPEEAK